MTNIRTILLIGKTGNGKSALANVISGSREFAESEGTISCTRDVKWVDFKDEGVEYRVIDTVGVGDTKLSTQQVLNKLVDNKNLFEDSLTQIIFVIGERFDPEEQRIYNLLRTVIFDEDVFKYTTIVRTKFSKFKKPEKCEEDRKRLIEESEELKKLIESCNKLLYVDNQPIDEEAEEKEEKQRLELNKKIREESRNRLLLHLRSFQKYYRPNNLDTLRDRINDYKSLEEKFSELSIKLNELLEINKKEKNPNFSDNSFSKEVIRGIVEIAKPLVLIGGKSFLMEEFADHIEQYHGHSEAYEAMVEIVNDRI